MSVRYHDVVIAGVPEVDLAIDSTSQNPIANSAVAAAIPAAIAASKCYYVGSTAPSNTNLLWIDVNNGLKYYNGSAWVTVPVAYNQ